MATGGFRASLQAPACGALRCARRCAPLVVALFCAVWIGGARQAGALVLAAGEEFDAPETLTALALRAACLRDDAAAPPPAAPDGSGEAAALAPAAPLAAPPAVAPARHFLEAVQRRHFRLAASGPARAPPPPPGAEVRIN